MKQVLLGLVVAASLFSGCATIVSHNRWPVAISSSPVGAAITITNRMGSPVYTGVTPAAVVLKSGSSFFKREMYKINFTLPGYSPTTTMLEADVNGWYFGNLLFGGAIGMLIVDPATGSMYRISQSALQPVNLVKLEALSLPPTSPNGLQIVSIDQVPASLRAAMVPLK